MDDWPPKKRERIDYLWWKTYSTRWGDNDMYGHINNRIYNSMFDTVVNYFLIKNADFDPINSNYMGVTPEIRCCYYKSIKYPETVDVGISVKRLGNSSITYDIGVFKKNSEELCAIGYFVHVYVERKNQNIIVRVPNKIAEACEKLLNN